MGTVRSRARFLAVVVALLGIQLGSLLIAPAYACGCGAMLPDAERRVSVGREESVVRWDGRREQIVMSLTVGGDAERAAWIMPVPNRATVRLGDPELFEEVREATAPVHRDRYYFWPRNGDWPLVEDDDTAGAPMPGDAAGAGVGVVGRQRLGSFDVARLTATDPAALDRWLRDNGFTFPARLRQALEPYVEQRWEYVAVRLAPDADGTVLTGTLDPIHLSFAADAPVYPMRLSRLAAEPQSLGLYVLADHRMEPRGTIGGAAPRVTYAGRVAEKSGALAQLAEGTPYPTAVTQEFPVPSRISGDHRLGRAASDATFQEVVWTDRLRTVAGIPAWLLTVGGAVAAVAALAVAGRRSVRRRSRRAALAGNTSPDYLR
ncbi:MULTISPECIES: DUF2330 domain-containing protein [unclassified Streptomyces]|uniref:DUF2330 domain-containing protein n=1 Tax=unclassified Streptomyces TaxID=2593676 RepID=UPI0009677062|nr:DUF2330 domain-containing protein [Streptomyces sp. TSRI0107]OKJ90793.1 hypothetical protein AMK31_03540 [Streptomyces sp. TSRI0107]